MGVLLALRVVVPIAEIAVMVKVAEAIGTWPDDRPVAVISVVGAWIVKRQGTGTLASDPRRARRRSVPGASLVDGGLLLLAGFLLVVPGFITSSSGCCCCSRRCAALVRKWLGRRFQVRAATYRQRVGPRPDGPIDVDSTTRDRPRWDPPAVGQ